MTTDWPVRLVDREVVLWPLATSDQAAWRRARQRNAAWLVPWDATVPPGGEARPTSFRQLVRRLAKQAREGTTFPFALEVDGRFAGQVTVNNIVRGSAQYASIGYWLDQDFAGRGIMPRAVALAIDHCFFTAGLHRIEIAIREGRHRQIRRMCDAIAHPVERLVRTRIGPVTLKGLGPGDLRDLTPAELRALMGAR